MADFKVIETQEELNHVIGERIARAKESALAEATEKYKDYDDLKAQNESYAEQIKQYTEQLEAFSGQADTIAQNEAKIKELQETAKKYESDSVKIRIALANGIPYEMAGRLTGTTEEEIAEDAKKMASYFSTSKKSVPASNPEAEAVDGVLAAFQKLNPNIKF